MATRPIKIAIIGDDSNLRKSLKGATRSVEGFGKRVGKIGAQAGLAFAGTAAAIGVGSVKAFLKFEEGMAEVMTLLPQAGEETFKELSDQVKSFSKEFGVLPDEAIPALYSALSAGVPKDNVFEFMEVAQKAAKGGVTDLETAVDGISSVINSYGDEVISATEASDLMFTAVRLGKTTFEEISGSIFQMAPIAAAVGIPFKDLTASVANLTAAGTPTAVAATQMKAAIAELGKSGTKADVAFREFTGMGLQQFLEEEGNFAAAMLTMKEGADDAGVSVLDMFGSIEAGQGVLALTADGGDSYIKTLQEMSASTGATEAAFLTMDSTMGASFDKIKANLSVLAIEIGEKVAPLVAKATDFILEGFEDLKVIIPKIKTTVTAWAEVVRRRVTPHIIKFRKAIEKVVDWVKTFIKENPHSALAALGVLIASIVVPAVIALVAAFAALFSPVVIGIAALAALAAGVVYAYENFETFRNIVDTVRDWLVNTLWPAMKDVAEDIEDVFWVLVKFFRDDFVPIVEGVVDTMTSIWTTLADFFTTYVEPIISAAIGAVMVVFDSLWLAIEGFYILIKGLFTGDMAAVWDGFKQLVEGIVTGIIAAFISLPMDIYNAAKPLIGILTGIANRFGTWLVDKIVDFIEAVPGKLWEFLGVVGEDMLSLGKKIGNWIIDGLVSALVAAKDLLVDTLKDILPDWLWDALGSIGGFFGNLLTSGGSKLSSRRLTNAPWERNWDPGPSPAFNAAAASSANLMGGVMSKLDLSRGGTDWFQNPETIIAFRQKGLMDEFNEFKAMGDVAGMEAFAAAGWQDPAPTNITMTVNAGMGTDGHQVGTQIVSALQQWERNNGSLPLNVSAA